VEIATSALSDDSNIVKPTVDLLFLLSLS
jgi:hypothetical protein